MRFFWLADLIRSTVMLIFLLVTSAQFSGTCIVALAYENLCLVGPTALASCVVISVQLRLLAKAPGSLRPSLGELPIALVELTAPVGLGDSAGAVADDAAADGAVAADDPIAAETVGSGPPLPLFEVHALSRASATHEALTAVAAALRWR
jgi:hypothetical protein